MGRFYYMQTSAVGDVGVIETAKITNPIKINTRKRNRQITGNQPILLLDGDQLSWS